MVGMERESWMVIPVGKGGLLARCKESWADG